jgi:hypothetical protein
MTSLRPLSAATYDPSVYAAPVALMPPLPAELGAGSAPRAGLMTISASLEGAMPPAPQAAPPPPPQPPPQPQSRPISTPPPLPPSPLGKAASPPRAAAVTTTPPGGGAGATATAGAVTPSGGLQPRPPSGPLPTPSAKGALPATARALAFSPLSALLGNGPDGAPAVPAAPTPPGKIRPPSAHKQLVDGAHGACKIPWSTHWSERPSDGGSAAEELAGHELAMHDSFGLEDSALLRDLSALLCDDPSIDFD